MDVRGVLGIIIGFMILIVIGLNTGYLEYRYKCEPEVATVDTVEIKVTTKLKPVLHITIINNLPDTTYLYQITEPCLQEY